MHTSSPPLSPTKSSSDETGKGSDSKTTQSQDVRSVFELRSRIRPHDLPSELDDYLTTTDKPHEIFEKLQDSRDRRLRLLLRRFTNQIQYGCTNQSCSVNTCLSYRRRHATTPLRPYSDVAARALAWRCLEQYATSNTVRPEDRASRSKQRSKSRTDSNSDNSCLCWNTPVVPWYEVSPEAGRSNKNTHRQSASSKRIGSIQPSQDSNEGNGHVRASNELHGIELDATSTSRSGDSERLPNRPSPLPDSESGPLDWSTATHESDSNRPKVIEKQRRVAFAEPLQDATPRQQVTLKDSASFVQTVFDTSPIIQLDRVKSQPSHHEKVKPIPSEDTSPLVSNNAISSAPTQNESCVVSTSGASQTLDVFTFKVLPLSAILWLRSRLPFDAQNSAGRDLNAIADHGPDGVFARQSIFFCLSNPFILLKSANTWRFIHPQPFKMEEQTRKRAVRELTPHEKVTLNSTERPRLAPPGGTMVVFGMLVAITSIPEVLDHLFAALQHAYVLPPEVARIQQASNASTKSQKVPQSRPQKQQRQSSNQQNSIPLDDDQVARLCMLVMLALQLILSVKPQSLTSTQARPLKDYWEQFSLARKSGVAFPQASLVKAWGQEVESRPMYQAYSARLDTLEGPSFQRLLDCVADVISHRLAVTEMKKTVKDARVDSNATPDMVACFIEEVSQSLKNSDPVMHKQTLQTNLVDMFHSVISRRWDREAIIRKAGPVFGALEALAALYRHRVDLNIPSAEFQWKFIAASFDDISMPVEWLGFRATSTRTHILAYSFLFEPSSLVTSFRAINSHLMKKSYDAASSIFKHAERFIHNSDIPIYGGEEVLSGMRPNMAKFFVLTIRRGNMLQDAMNQLWRRQRQELTRPLKVQLGKDEGEDGLDHGGVQVEFFRLVFAEALDPQYGMFTTDERTRMMWFQPGSLEPLYKFETLGILMSLAVYNGITLPVTFPLAFYRKLLDLKIKSLEHIKDGWPELAQGLQQLLDWKDGDVGDVIARTYEFSYEAFGARHTIDMTKVRKHDTWPVRNFRRYKEKRKTTSFEPSAHISTTPSADDDIDPYILDGVPYTRPMQLHVKTNTTPSNPSSSTASSPTSASLPEYSAPVVTNATRDQYVKDYIHWLTTKSIHQQFTAFATGFYTCLSRTALSIFTPDHLQTVIEGHQQIDIDGLQATATYDDYKPTDEVILWFWSVVRDMSPSQHKQLLEFVTASDRVPVNGIGSIVFIVQRNGEGDERLPSSSTCYGRLLLPQYSSKEVLRAKLEKAVENSVGFGSL